MHGICCAAWCWAEHWLPYFARHGYVCWALSLRGHGASAGRERLRWTSLADYVADVAQVAAQMDRPPIVMGHSMGGMIVQKYLETHPAPAGILLAAVPPQGGLRATLRAFRRQPRALLKAAWHLNMFHTLGTPGLAREACFSAGVPQEVLAGFVRRLQDESIRAYLDMVLLDLPRPGRVKTPLLVLGAAQDVLVAPDEVEATGRAYGARTELFPGMAHMMMLEAGWQVVADRILAWLAEQGL